jgi:hypothetical protein
VPEERRGYIVRAAGTPSRPGPVSKIYPYTLRALLDAMEDARFQSFAGVPQELVKTEGRERTVIRRYEGGRDAGVLFRGPPLPPDGPRALRCPFHQSNLAAVQLLGPPHLHNRCLKEVCGTLA